ncbi:hypothetical protein DFJ74DRAFT_738129 [Hyaloraphidium curvatum]|nr:hypothetical protein DFJ74DRAFT_738110 [Hyaloraphidium curvatum]KAI9010299.1 hypothetical protein DFJ74DRAFT_738129 [Hyaloraphidium curvatum]
MRLAFAFSALLAAVAALSAPGDAQRLPLNRAHPVCVVGAGAAGLSAAAALRAANVPAVVLEGRQRAGGRVWALPMGNGAAGNEPFPVDMGAAWLHGDAASGPLFRLASPRFSQSAVTNFDAGLSFLTSGEEVEADPVGDWEAFVEGPLEEERTATENADRDPTLLQLINAATGGQPEQERLRREYQASVQVANEYAADPSQLSGWNYDSASDVPGADRLWRNGYFEVLRPLMAGLNITYGVTVSRVALVRDTVLLTTSRGPYRCSRVILTVPLGVLKANRIAFSPPLPATKLASIRRLGFGAFAKIALRFPPSALPLLPPASIQSLTFRPRTFAASNVRGGPYDFVLLRSLRPAARSPVVVAIAGGQLARAIESQPPAAAAARVLAQLRLAFPGLPAPIFSAVTSWTREPFSLGAYSFMAPGSSRADYDEIARPLNTSSGVPWLQMAGEHAGSWPYPSTVHGAYEAGRRAAAVVVATRTRV